MSKRIFDVIVSGVGLLLIGPLLLSVMLIIYLQDRHSPIYKAIRAGKNGQPFQMYKIRSMVVNAERIGGSSTSNSDPRITAIGRFVRRYKLDEFSQLWNVFVGDMSLVGPRPNTVEDVKLYTEAEKKLLNIAPGITDFSSIVFSDEGAILDGAENPDLRYNQIIRPWKNRLGLLYVEKHSLLLDIELIILTIVTIVSKPTALKYIQKILDRLEVDDLVKQMAKRDGELKAYPPPGAEEIYMVQ